MRQISGKMPGDFVFFITFFENVLCLFRSWFVPVLFWWGICCNICIAGMLFIALQQSCCNATMPCRQVIAYQLTPIPLFGGFLPVFGHLLGHFCRILAVNMIVYRNSGTNGEQTRGAGGSHAR